MNAEEIFNKAIELSDPCKQAEYLDEACGGDEKLRTEVEALLKWHTEAGDFLEVPPVDPDATLEQSAVEGSGTIIGRYKLLEKVGEGGMATVYMAEQKHPIRRRVALKIIKLGMDSKQVIGRFETERQALAMMDHPNIAKVLDAGTTETGRPYFVMELVRGVPITEFCDSNHLTPQERLELFIAVCQAVQHAHQKGIIHRDIKPSNIMVTLHDGEPVVKVIDFGIAKAMNQQLTEKTVFTRYAQMIGTPEYMSPEQAELSGLDIDTRTDVFSLGVLLYELLTGTTPFDSEYLLSKGYSELQRIIREEEPLRPSTKVSTMGDALTDVAKHRRTSPELLCKLIRSDLDWIVMKTLEKDRSRRYESVSELAADVKRHLNHEPVLAGRPSTVYKIQKFVKRNRTLCFSSVAVAVSLFLAVIISSHQARVAQKARKAEADARAVMKVERDRAREAEQSAQKNLYDSLLREARATRIARGTGYREEAFHALRQARDLEVPHKNLVELRREAVACLGDCVGLQPMSLIEMSEEPNTPQIWWGVLHPTQSLWDDYQQVLQDVRNVASKAAQTRPAIASECKLCHWRSVCKQQVRQSGDLTLIPELGRSKRDVLAPKIPTIKAMAKVDVTSFVRDKKTIFPRIGAATLEKFQRRAKLLTDPYARPLVTASITLPNAETELFFDIETDPMRDLCYLHGFVERNNRDNSTEQFHAFVANEATEAEEERAFAEAWAYVQSRQPCLIYYYSKYERTWWRKLRDQYPHVATEQQIEAMFDPSVCIDLYGDVVHGHIEWPTNDYSIKTLAKYLGFNWRDTEPSGAASIEWYHTWVESGDPQVRQRILDYNEDDCVAMRVLLDGIRKLT